MRKFNQKAVSPQKLANPREDRAKPLDFVKTLHVSPKKLLKLPQIRRDFLGIRYKLTKKKTFY